MSSKPRTDILPILGLSAAAVFLVQYQLPLILFGGPLWYGMANVIAFGLAVGTALTLGVVPVLYSLFFEPRRRRGGEAA